MRYEKGVEAFDLDSLVARAAPGPVAIVDLGRTAWVSHHVAIVREGEVPHYHRFHDLTVVVLRGEGIIDIEGRRIALKPGDVAYVQRGVRHYFRNTGKDAGRRVRHVLSAVRRPRYGERRGARGEAARGEGIGTGAAAEAGELVAFLGRPGSQDRRRAVLRNRK